jgi:hypothetical protein
MSFLKSKPILIENESKRAINLSPTRRPSFQNQTLPQNGDGSETIGIDLNPLTSANTPDFIFKDSNNINQQENESNSFSLRQTILKEPQLQTQQHEETTTNNKTQNENEPSTPTPLPRITVQKSLSDLPRLNVSFSADTLDPFFDDDLPSSERKSHSQPQSAFATATNSPRHHRRRSSTSSPNEIHSLSASTSNLFRSKIRTSLTYKDRNIINKILQEKDTEDYGVTVLITQCIQEDFLRPLLPTEPLPNSLHVSFCLKG